MRIALLVALSLIAPTSVLADPLTPRIVRPLVLELVGYFAPDREHARADGADAITVRVGDRTRWFAAERARTTGDAPVAGRTVLSALAPIEPNLIARGDEDLSTRLAEAPDGVAVRMEGVVDRGSRTYLLRSVEVRKP